MKAKATRANSVAGGAKVMLAAASVAATIGGWAAISSSDIPGAITPTQAVAEQSTTNLTLPLLQINPLPTVVPAQSITTKSASDAAVLPPSAAPASAAQPTVAVPTATAITLRAVNPSTSKRPQPVTRSRSSR